MDQTSLRGRWFASCLLVALGSCGIVGTEDFVDFDEYTLLPRLEDLDFSNVNVREGIVYWELRQSLDFQERVIASGGVIGRDSLDPLVLAALDSISSYYGFTPSCLPGVCFFYIATVSESGEIEVWETPQRALELLTPIESIAEAALQALSNGFYWSGELETSAYRTVTIGFELVVLKLVNDCEPVQVNQFLLGFTSEGDIFDLKQREFSTAGVACI